jgi:hypothetical protein
LDGPPQGKHRRDRAIKITALNSIKRKSTMKRSYKTATAVVLTLGLGLTAAAYAQQGQMGSGMGPGMQGEMKHDMKGSMGHGGMTGGAEGRMPGNQLMTPEERTALRDKMRNATPEERQKLAATTHAEMQKRAQEKGITLPEHRGPRGHMGAGPAPQSPADTEHVH